MGLTTAITWRGLRRRLFPFLSRGCALLFGRATPCGSCNKTSHKSHHMVISNSVPNHWPSQATGMAVGMATGMACRTPQCTADCHRAYTMLHTLLRFSSVGSADADLPSDRNMQALHCCSTGTDSPISCTSKTAVRLSSFFSASC